VRSISLSWLLVFCLVGMVPPGPSNASCVGGGLFLEVCMFQIVSDNSPKFPIISFVFYGVYTAFSVVFFLNVDLFCNVFFCVNWYWVGF